MNESDAARLLEQGLGEDTLCTSCRDALIAGARFCPSCGAPAPQPADGGGDPLRSALEAKLRGQYRIVRLLGRGGMGAVYLARDLTLEREVAIKVVKSGGEGRESYERFRREARTAAKLAHPNVVPLHAFGEVEGLPYVVMGYVRGESLAARLRRDGRMSEDDARRVLADVADALDHAHRQGVIHRDVKPDNVLLDDQSGRALLTDFGVAKALHQGETLTRHGSVIGTPHYMSPEQAAGEVDVDGRSDLYSLGVMAYAMLAGRLPFDGKTPADVLAQHLTQEPPPLRALAPTVSETTVQAVERCLAKDRDKRWPDARSLKQALGTSTSDTLPEALEEVSGHGVPFAAVSIVLLLLAWMVVVRMQHAPPAVLAVIGGMLCAGYASVLVALRVEGFPLALAQRVIWTEPSWWRTWYPRAFRRRGNVWDRLPASVRRVRAFMPLILVAFVAVLIEPTSYFFPKIAAAVSVTLATVVLELIAKRELKRHGVTRWRDLSRVAIHEPLSRPAFWAQPRIAAILAPPPGERETPHGSPHEQLQSILRVAGELPAALRPLGVQAASAARQLLGAIEDADREMAGLARNVEPGEEERLGAKIDALAGQDANPLRALLEKQLELIRGLNARIEEVRASRARHVEMLRNLTLHVASLRARSSEAPTEVMSLSDRVRLLCDDIAREGTPADGMTTQVKVS